MPAPPLSVAVLVSGEGTTLDGLAELASGGAMPVRIVLVACDRPNAPAIERARRRGLRTIVLPFRGSEPSEWSRTLSHELESAGTDLVVLAGFLSVLPPTFTERWTGRTINVHPSLLPRFGGPGLYGAKVHRAVLDAGATETGATVHVVTQDVDRGPILGQVSLPVRPSDTPESLRERLHPHEVRLLAEVLGRFADGTFPLPYPVPVRAPAPLGAGPAASDPA